MNRKAFELYPAIDLRDGAAGRLTQGDFSRQQGYGDPLELARRLVGDGAPWLHVVDLDAARTGAPANRDTILAIAREVDVPVQAGGGIRSNLDVDSLLSGGVERVVLGTAALDHPELVLRSADRHPGQVALGVDYRSTAQGTTEVAVRGWEQGSGRTVTDVLQMFEEADLGAVVVTAIDRDGTLEGPEVGGLWDFLSATDVPMIASGGVSSAADIAVLAALEVASASGPAHRLAGVITGKALLEGRFTVAEGVAACTRSG